MAKAAIAKKNSAFMKRVQPSEDLAKIVGTEPLPRTEVTKKIWAHIKKHKLQNPQNRREILADDKLQPIFWREKDGYVSDGQSGQ
jgi:upstream activation factor subunit UAF30